MSVYKEGFHCKALLEKRAVKIFEDAADFGTPVKQGDNLWNAAHQLVTWYGDPETRVENRYPSGCSVHQSVFLQSENSERPEAFYYLISYVSCTSGKCKGYDGYVYILPITPSTK